jgi:hypothetical protein
MEPQDVTLIESLLAGASDSSHAELRRLWDDHQEFERELESLRRRLHLTPEEESREREIRKLKLAGRDRIEAILRTARSGDSRPAQRAEGEQSPTGRVTPGR